MFLDLKFLVEEYLVGQLFQIYNIVKEKVQTLLNTSSNIAITTDIWTSMNTDSYLTMTVHYLNQTKLETFVLCTKKLERSHTCMYLFEVITEELNNWNTCIYKKSYCNYNRWWSQY